MLQMLYIVATPIGNLDDITLRALQVLRSADLVLAEDTRTARKIGIRHGFEMRLVSFTEHSFQKKAEWIIGLLKEGKNLALVSESGTPTISDPGARLVSECQIQGIKVIPIPGPSAVIAAASVSGLATDSFYFEGFLPRKKNQRVKVLNLLKREAKTLIFFESPYRVQESLKDMLDVFGERKITICREMTKVYEEVISSALENILGKFTGKIPKGEFTIVVEGSKENS